MTTDPTQPEPGYQPPANTQYDYGQPASGQPYNQPTYPPAASDQPTYAQPGYDQPPYTPPTYAQPTSAQPMTGQPAYGQPGYPPPAGFPQGAVAGGFPAMSYGVDAYGRPLSDKSKVVAGILGIVLGAFGAGRFYMGDTKTGVLQLVVSIFTCGLGHLWGLIDGIMILINGGVDAQGRVLRD